MNRHGSHWCCVPSIMERRENNSLVVSSALVVENYWSSCENIVS